MASGILQLGQECLAKRVNSPKKLEQAVGDQAQLAQYWPSTIKQLIAAQKARTNLSDSKMTK